MQLNLEKNLLDLGGGHLAPKVENFAFFWGRLESEIVIFSKKLVEIDGLVESENLKKC